MKKSILTLITLFLFLLEAMIFSRWTVEGVGLPLVLTFGLAVAVTGDRWDVLFIALLTGFLQDLYVSHWYGLHMLVNLYVFLGVHLLKNHLRQEKNVLMAGVMVLACVMRSLIVWGVYTASGLTLRWQAIPVLAFMTLVLAFPALWGARSFYKPPALRHRLRG
ncbi:hypothetical protein ABB02_00463 [Clostridiaceae bacterium JG1575]|nr:hypothetical protein ABB02_00463 [Clostridiaceae bacterium JG1575]